MIKKYLTVCVLAGLTTVTQAAVTTPFTVKNIEFAGLQRISPNTAQENVPILPGQTLTPDLSNAVIDDLFKSGYFDNIQLWNDQSNLLIQVNERPTIGSVNINGNVEIKTENLEAVLLKVGIQVGNVFNYSLLNQISQSLEQEYYSQGKFAVQVTPEVTQLPRNRVAINLNISEGLYAKIERITLVGAHAFPVSTLVSQMEITTPHLWSFLTRGDQYSSDNINKSLQALQSYYLNRGYINFHIDSVQTSLDPTHRYMFVTVNITEGDKYTVSGYSLEGNLILPQSTLQALVKLKAGDVFSRQNVLDSVTAIQNALGNQGYAFAKVNPVPSLDAKNKQVKITFNIDPGRKIYIHHVDFSSNRVTNDQTFREQLQYYEGSLYNYKAMNDSKVAIQRLPYVNSGGVEQKVKPVAGSPDLADVNYDISERNANRIGGTLGYSDLDGVLLGANLNMMNVFGTPNSFGIGAQISKPYKSFNLSYTDPFFTQNGISQTWSTYFTQVDNAERNLTDFSTNSFGFTNSYNIPIDIYDSYNVGAGFDHTELLQPGSGNSMTVTSYINQNGSNYHTYSLQMGWARNSTETVYFPDHGDVINSAVKVSVPGSSQTWYQWLNNATWYYGITDKTLFEAYGSVNYGDGYGKTDNLPFFDNYYGGGWGTVRGFAGGSLGPKDTLQNCINGVCTNSAGESIGGNLAIYGSLNLLFPVPFVDDSKNLRLAVFMDAGNDYLTYNSSSVWTEGGYTSPKYPTFNNLRYSAGVALEWYSPLGPMGFSLAKPMNVQAGDQTEIFQFQLGTTF